MVGAEQAILKVSTKLLVQKSPFFKGALTGNFKEADERKIVLEGFSTDVFCLYLRWLYDEDTWNANGIAKEDHARRAYIWANSLELSIIADRTMTPKLQNKLIDMMVVVSSNVYIPIPALQRVWDHVVHVSRLQTFIMDYYLADEFPRKYVADTCDSQGFSKSFLSELLKRVAEVEIKQLNRKDLWKRELPGRCEKYHIHEEGEATCT